MGLVSKIKFWLKKKKKVFLIEHPEDLNLVKKSIKQEKFLGIDTEFDWRNTYFPRLSLLQISTSERIFLIDYLKCKDLYFLKGILEDMNKLIIFHSSRSDTTILNTNLNIRVKKVFDIQIAEKNINGGKIRNYGSIVNNYFSIKLNKSETNSDWLRRPLNNKQLRYAADDVSFLIDIYKKQIKKLKKLELLEKTFKESTTEANLGNQELFVSRLNKIKKLPNLEKEIFLWREKLAIKKNIPPSFIFFDKSLKEISKITRRKKIEKSSFYEVFKKKSYVEIFMDEMNI
tara:strand:- start:1527 stop:2387 length:861 start_codon:yes stop_codon:yes gene_type:complete